MLVITGSVVPSVISVGRCPHKTKGITADPIIIDTIVLLGTKKRKRNQLQHGLSAEPSDNV